MAWSNAALASYAASVCPLSCGVCNDTTLVLRAVSVRHVMPSSQGALVWGPIAQAPGVCLMINGLIAVPLGDKSRVASCLSLSLPGRGFPCALERAQMSLNSGPACCCRVWRWQPPGWIVVHYTFGYPGRPLVTHKHQQCRLPVVREFRGVVPEEAAASSKCSCSFASCRHRHRRLCPGTSPCLAALPELSLMTESPLKGTAPLFAYRPRTPRWPCRLPRR